MSLHVVWVDTEAEFESRAEAWDRLAQDSVQQLPQLSATWVRAYRDTMLGPGERLSVAIVCDGDHTVAALPLVRCRPSIMGVGAPRYRTPYDFALHTRSGDAVAERGREREALSTLFQAILRRPPRWHSLALRGLVDGSPARTALHEAGRRILAVAGVSDYGSYLPVGREAGDLEARLSRNFRANLRKARTKLAAAGPHEFRRVPAGQAGEDDLRRFLALEASGWKGRQGTALVQDPALLRFYTALVRGLRGRGWLEWHFLESGERLLAANLGIRLGRTLCLLKIAYDEEFAHCAPGNLLFESIAVRAHLDGDLDRIDCLTDMPWHRNWRMEQRSYVNYTLYPRRILPCLLGFLPHRAYARMRQARSRAASPETRERRAPHEHTTATLAAGSEQP